MSTAALPASVPTRRQVVPSSVLGMLIFVVAETMFFSGLMSALTINKASAVVNGLWTANGTVSLPVHASGWSTGLVVLSGVVLLFANRAFLKQSKVATALLGAAWLLGAAFLGVQAWQWRSLLGAGLTLTSSAQGAFFYLIVGGHALHALLALLALGLAFVRLLKGTLAGSFFFGAQVFWYFAVLMWPVIYARVYF